jgi:hypothetical protein
MAHSKSGWTTIETFPHFLDFLRDHYNDEESLWPVLDCYSVDPTEEIKKHADELGIHLVFIPAGMADAFHSFDWYVFGVIKANLERYTRNSTNRFVNPMP